MTATQLQTLPMLITTNSTGSVNPNRNSSGNSISRVRAKRNLFGAPPPGEIKKICNEEYMKKCIEFKEKYNYDIQNERFTNINNNYNNNNNNNDDNDDEITTTTTTPPPPPTSTINSDNLLEKNLHNSECDVVNDDNHDIDNKISQNDDNIDGKNLVGKCNKSLIDIQLNNSFKICDVMCNEINSTTSSITTSSTVPSVATLKDKKFIDLEQKNQRFAPSSKKQSQQILLSDMFKIRKASPVNLTRPQKANVNFDETDEQQQPQHQEQPQQDQHLTSNEA